MKTYTYQYDNLTVTYEMEGDVDKNHAMLQSAIDEYEFTQEMPGIFIDNKKQRVPKGNKVLKAFKR